MNIAIALAQFIMLALATMASRILVNSGAVSQTNPGLADQAALFVANQGLWLLVIPAAWLMFAEWCTRKKNALAQMVQGIGVGITMLILVGIVLMLTF